MLITMFTFISSLQNTSISFTNGQILPLTFN